MRAIVVHEPGGPEVLRIEEREAPESRPGWVRVRVRAFGLNQRDLVTREGGLGDAVKFPRVIGSECAGEVVDAGDSGLAPGQKIIAAMGGMGRDFDGSHQELALLPATSVIPVRALHLTWGGLAAIPASFGVAWGSLELLQLQAGESLLVRGAASSVGMAAITLAKARGVHVVGTTRQESKRAALAAHGADVVLEDDRPIAGRLAKVDALLELVGPLQLADSLTALKPGGRACVSGDLARSVDVDRDLTTAAAERAGITLHQFDGSVIDRTSFGATFQHIIDGAENGHYRVVVDRRFPFNEISDAHRYFETNQAVGKVVVVTA